MGAFLKLFLLALLLTTATTTTTFASFDFWKLALQWPPTAAAAVGSVYLPNPPRFTIHGLWHDNYNGSTCNCRARQRFNYNRLHSAYVRNVPLFSLLSYSWPNVQYGPDETFWEHEWDKHGGCSKSQVGHFEMGLNLYYRFNIWTALSTHVSLNTNSPTPVLLQTINDSIKAITHGKVPILKCLWDNGREKLQEVHLCFNYSVPLHHPVTDCPLPPGCNYGCYNHNRPCHPCTGSNTPIYFV